MQFFPKSLGALGLGAALIACAASPAQSQTPAPSQSAATDPYAAYEFLIGEWDTAGSGTSPAVAIQRFRWGPNRSYIWYSTSTVEGGAEHLHFEGLLVYNAANRNLDFLAALEPGSFGQEHGVLRVGPDGSVVREVTLVDASGAIGHFRQTFRATGADSAVTTLMRQTADGAWAPNFPGSDNLLMTRRGD